MKCPTDTMSPRKDILFGLEKPWNKIFKGDLINGQLIIRTMDPRKFVQGRFVVGRPITPSFWLHRIPEFIVLVRGKITRSIKHDL